MTEHINMYVHENGSVKCAVHTVYSSTVNDRFWYIEFRFSEDGRLRSAVGRLSKEKGRNGEGLNLKCH